MPDLPFRYFTLPMFLGLYMLANSISAQEKKLSVYLKNGDVVVGEIIEDNDYFIRIVDASNDTIKVGYKRIFKAGKTKYQSRRWRDRIVKSKGISVSIMGNLAYDFDFYRENYHANLNVTKRLKEGKINIGLSLGFEQINFVANFRELNNYYVSSSIYARYYVNKKNTRFLLDGSIGYSWAVDSVELDWLTHEYKGEVISELGIGLHFPSTSKTSLLLRTGANYLRTHGEFSNNPNSENKTSYSQRIINPYIGLAIEF